MCMTRCGSHTHARKYEATSFAFEGQQIYVAPGLKVRPGYDIMGEIKQRFLVQYIHTYTKSHV